MQNRVWKRMTVVVVIIITLLSAILFFSVDQCPNYKSFGNDGFSVCVSLKDQVSINIYVCVFIAKE